MKSSVFFLLLTTNVDDGFTRKEVCAVIVSFSMYFIVVFCVVKVNRRIEFFTDTKQMPQADMLRLLEYFPVFPSLPQKYVEQMEWGNCGRQHIFFSLYTFNGNSAFLWICMHLSQKKCLRM